MSDSRLKKHAITAAPAATGLASADIQTSDGPVTIGANDAPINLFTVNRKRDMSAINFASGSWSGWGQASAAFFADANGASFAVPDSGVTIDASRSGTGGSIFQTMVFSHSTTVPTSGFLANGTKILGFSITESENTHDG